MTHSRFAHNRPSESHAPYRWERLAAPSIFLIGTFYYEELFLKLYCFGSVSFQGALFTLLLSIPPALLLGLFCASPSPRTGKIRMFWLLFLYSVWMSAQTVYYHLFKTFLSLFSITKTKMVAGAFGSMALEEILLNWFPILMLMIPVYLFIPFQNILFPEDFCTRKQKIRWFEFAAVIQLCTILLILCCNQGILSLRYIYTQAAVPELEVQNFGIFTQTTLELRRIAFGIQPDDHAAQQNEHSESALVWQEPTQYTPPFLQNRNMINIDFDMLIQEEQDETLVELHKYFSSVEPTKKNPWTGYFKGKNLIWIVAEGFCSQVLDPVRTPTLYKLSNSGFVFEHFYTPLWGVSTSDGEYVTTTGLIPKPGIWSYSRSAQNEMPFAFGNQFKKQGYTTLAYHNYLYSYYDRDQSFPNMGYDYRAIGNGLDMKLIENFPSDLEMMEKIVPQFINEDQFLVYCLTVSGHLNYTREENAMCRRHWDEVKDLPYSDCVKCYLACQMELELAVRHLIQQLSDAGKLEDTVIVLSGDHYPYGLTDEEYSELLGHSVDPVFEIYENTLILWNSEMEEPIMVDKYCSSLDVMPTLSNLFGLEYDSRLIAGKDILSDTPGLVIFSNYSFLTQEGAYNSTTDEFVRWDGKPVTEQYLTAQRALVQNRVAYSAAILDHDYYRAVFRLSSES